MLDASPATELAADSMAEMTDVGLGSGMPSLKIEETMEVPWLSIELAMDSTWLMMLVGRGPWSLATLEMIDEASPCTELMTLLISLTMLVGRTDGPALSKEETMDAMGASVRIDSMAEGRPEGLSLTTLSMTEAMLSMGGFTGSSGRAWRRYIQGT